MSERVAVCVYTHHQPDMLQACLESLAAQQVPAGMDLRIVVVDSDEGMLARPTVNAFRKECPFPVTYVHQPKPGTAAARQAALDAAFLHVCDWVAFIGEHEMVAPHGIAQLMRSAQ